MTEIDGRTREARASRETADTRADGEGERRRKRTDLASVDPSLRRFGVSEDFIDTDKYVYRAAVDEKTRLIELTQNDDYDFVNAKGAKAAGAEAEGVLRYQSGRNVDGSPLYTYLLRKLKRHAEEDRVAKDAKIEALEARRLKATPDDAPEQSYKPR